MKLVSVFDWRLYPFVEVLPWSESIGLSVEPCFANTLEKSWVSADRRGSPDNESRWTLLPLVTRQPQRRCQVGVQQPKSLDNDGLGQVEALPGDHEEAENQHDNFFSDEVRKSLEKIAVFPHKHKAGRQRGTNFDRLGAENTAVPPACSTGGPTSELYADHCCRSTSGPIQF